MSLNTAFLPGVGPIEGEPKPNHYRWAIGHLRADLRRQPAQGKWVGGCWRKDPRIVLRDRLSATLRRLEWTPAKLKEMAA